MLTKTDRTSKFKAIEVLRKVRVANLERLKEAHGTWAALGRATGHGGTFLIAIHSGRRNIGEVLARDIERQLKLLPLWLDKTH